VLCNLREIFEIMATKAGSRPRIVSVRNTSVDQARNFLETLPEKTKENFSLREAVDKLRDQIQAVLAKGYSYQELALMLSDKGIKISAATLKNYVPSGRRQSAKDKDKAEAVAPRRRRKEPTEDAIAPVEQQDAAREITSAKLVVQVSEEEPETLEESMEASAFGRAGRKRSGSTAKTTAATKPATRGRAKTTTDKQPTTRGRKKAEN
jgi:hypothetical protein